MIQLDWYNFHANNNSNNNNQQQHSAIGQKEKPF